MNPHIGGGKTRNGVGGLFEKFLPCENITEILSTWGNAGDLRKVVEIMGFYEKKRILQGK